MADERTLRRLSLRDLHTLMAVIQAGGIGKAAERLNYSQPAVSKSIAKLERTFGQRLLERGRDGVQLTRYGEALVRCGVDVFDDLRIGVSEIEFLSDPTVGEARIGCTEPVSAGIVSAGIHQLSRKYPRINFYVEMSTPASICEDLEARKVDFVITQLVAQLREPRFAAAIMYDEPVVVVAGIQHPLTRKRRLRLADLVDQPWTLPWDGSFISTCLSSAFRQEGLNPPVPIVTGPSAYFRMMLIMGGHFVTVLPTTMLTGAAQQLPIRTLPIDLPQNRRPVGIITLKGRALSPVARLFVDHMRSLSKKDA